MKKNFQLFMFFLFTLLAGLLVYLGNDIVLRLNELDDKVVKFDEDLKSMRGALNVVKNFEGVIDKEGKGTVIDQDGKPKKADSLLPAEGFYCSAPIEEGNGTEERYFILELTKDYNLKLWNVTGDETLSFSRNKKPEATGSYFIRGIHIYTIVRVNGVRQNRKFEILKVDGRGFATQIDLATQHLSAKACPNSVQLAY